MPLVSKFQAGFKDESVWGTAVTVDRFCEAHTSTILPDHRRIESKNMRAGARVQRSTSFAVWKAGASGTFGFEPLSKGFGWWLKHMLGTVASSSVTDSRYVHTGTIGDLRGDSFTFQDNRPFSPSDTDQPMTFEGGKVTSWDLSCASGGLVDFKATLDFENYATATALAAASYPTGTVEPFSFVGAAVSIGGSTYNFSDSVRVTCDNRLRLDRFPLKATGLKDEQIENDFRGISWEIGAEFDAMTQFNRFASATAAGALATIIFTFVAPTLVGVSVYPELVVTIDQARFDALDNGVTGPNQLMQKLSGRGLFNSNSALTVEYKSADATP